MNSLREKPRAQGPGRRGRLEASIRSGLASFAGMMRCAGKIRAQAIAVAAMLILGCANGERDASNSSDNGAADSRNAAMSMTFEPFGVWIPLDGMRCGMLCLWEHLPGTPGLVDTASPIRGRSGELTTFTLEIVNFSSEAKAVPTFEELAPFMRVGERNYPLLPLDRFPDEFIHLGTLALLAGTYPHGEIAGRSLTRVPLAARFSRGSSDSRRPPGPFRCRLEGNIRTLSWIQLEPGLLETFLDEPTEATLEALLGRK